VLHQQQAQITYLNRNIARAEALANDYSGTVCGELKQIKNFSLIINTTPVGMYPEANISPLADFIFHDQHIVFDMIYNPQQTLLLQQAKAAGAKTINGVPMFVAQACMQVQHWSGHEVDIDKMYHELLSHVF
jgi:shikimate 5-dehydrogenase